MDVESLFVDVLFVVNAVVNSVLQIVGYVLISICWFQNQVFADVIPASAVIRISFTIIIILW